MRFTSKDFGKDYFDNGLGSNYGGKNSMEYNKRNYLPAKRELVNNIVKRIGIPKNVCCLGCGRGFLPLAFKYIGSDAFGIDISDYAIETAPKEIKDKLVVGDCSDNAFMMKIPALTYELVTGFDVLEHIKVPYLYNTILHAIRISKRWFMVNVPVKNIDNEPDESKTSTDSTHVSIYSPAWWITKICEIGKPFNLELREVQVVHTEETYNMFAIFERHK